MNCGGVRIDLDEDQQMKRLICNEGVRLQEQTQGRTVAGRRAVYDPILETIEIWGHPVVLRDRRGSRLQGGHLVYNLREGSVEFVKPPPAKPAAAPPETPAPAAEKEL